MSGSKAGWRTRWVAAAACATAVGCSSEPAPRSAATPAGPGTVCQSDPRPLTLADGIQLYVEPQNLFPVGGELLVSGTPTYSFDVGVGRNAAVRSRGAYVAAFLGDPARAVPNPIDGVVESVTAVALGEGRWAAIFKEVDTDTVPGGERQIGLWYGEHDGSSWSLVEPMPAPASMQLSLRASSRLVRAGDRLAWVAQEASLEDLAVHFYARVDGAWRSTRLPDPFAEGVALGYEEGSGLWLVLIGVDPDLPGWQKSIRLYRENTGWELVSRVAILESGVEVLWPSVTVLPGGVTISWIRASQDGVRALARTGIAPGNDGTLLVLDEGAEYLVPVSMPDSALAWVVDHADPITQLRELRLLRIVGESAARVASTPSPLTGFFSVAPIGPDEVLVVGPEMGTAPTQAPVRSLILRLSASC